MCIYLFKLWKKKRAFRVASFQIHSLRVILPEKKMSLSFKNSSFLLQIKGKTQFLWAFKTEGYYEDLPIIYMLLENMITNTLDWTLYDNRS